MKMGTRTLVIDQAYMPRGVISSERAFVIHYKGNAEVIANHPEKFGLVNADIDIYKPSIIRVPSYINTKFQKVPLTRENVFKRDNYECVYCGCSDRKRLTIDHVIPKSKGGPDSFENWVTACKKCNNEKADLTLKEYGKQIPKPYRPHHLLMIKKVGKVPEEWKPYLMI